MKLSQITKIAISQAKRAMSKNDVPIGAVVFNQSEVISKAYNNVVSKKNPLGHAEVIALQKASKKLMRTNLMDYSLYVTLEPCIICCYIISRFKIGSLYFGSYDTVHGSIQNGDKVFINAKNIYKPQIYGGIGEKESSALLYSFFKKIRKNS